MIRLATITAVCMAFFTLSACCQPPEKPSKSSSVATPASKTSAIQNVETSSYASGELLIKFKPDVNKESIKSLLSAHSVTIIKEYNFAPLYHVRLPENLTVMAGKKLFGSMPEVEYAEPNYKRKMLKK